MIFLMNIQSHRIDSSEAADEFFRLLLTAFACLLGFVGEIMWLFNDFIINSRNLFEFDGNLLLELARKVWQ